MSENHSQKQMNTALIKEKKYIIHIQTHRSLQYPTEEKVDRDLKWNPCSWWAVSESFQETIFPLNVLALLNVLSCTAGSYGQF